MSWSYQCQAAGSATGIEGLHNFCSLTPVWLWTTKTKSPGRLVNKLSGATIYCFSRSVQRIPTSPRTDPKNADLRKRERSEVRCVISFLAGRGSRNAHDAKEQKKKGVGGVPGRGMPGRGGGQGGWGILSTFQ